MFSPSFEISIAIWLAWSKTHSAMVLVPKIRGIDKFISLSQIQIYMLFTKSLELIIDLHPRLIS